jgi:hypothetical protein
LWATGIMGKDIFECLIDDIEPDSALSWPTVIQETIQKLRTDEETLQSSVEYGEFIQGEYVDCMQNGRLSFVVAILDPSRQSQSRHRKRRRSDDEDQVSIRGGK